MAKNKLVLRFDPHTIEHLGIKMYSHLPAALAELVANAYDAAATKVEIRLLDLDKNNKQILISDNGEGMSYSEVQQNFLVIGRKRRIKDISRENSKCRKITGRKGLGKLALFGIGKNIKIETTKRNQKLRTIFTLDWDLIISEEGGQYSPKSKSVKKNDFSEAGTTIILSKLVRRAGFDAKDTAISLSRLFNCFDDQFVVSVQRNNDRPIILSQKLCYEGIVKQFEWKIEDLVDTINRDYFHKHELRGYILSTEKPISQDLRGIILYANGRLVNRPGFLKFRKPLTFIHMCLAG
jgi:hypothetical protein